MQFADDILCFIKVEESLGLNLKYLLLIFETILGLKVNLSKSSMDGIGVGMQETIFARLFGCKVEAWPLKYLGLLLSGFPRSLSFWDPVAERVQKKMVS